MNKGMVLTADSLDEIVAEIKNFLLTETPRSWISYALNDLPTLLIDHANCEYKAAATGMALINRYRNNSKLQYLMTRLVREEILHYEQVLKFMERLGIDYRPVPASRYAVTLRNQARTSDPGRLTDVLIISAIVEARSCERFAALYKELPKELGRYYRSLLKSEGRHYRDYLSLAYESASHNEVENCLKKFLVIDSQLITSTDQEFRFHSGVPKA